MRCTALITAGAAPAVAAGRTFPSRLIMPFVYSMEKKGEGKSMRTVRDVLKEKGGTIWTIPPEAKVFQALELMAEKNIGAVLVMEKGSLVGILSERDYVRKGIIQGRAAKDTSVREIMTEGVLYVRPEQSIEECMALMTNKRVRHLPVFEGERLAGMISIGDVVKAIIADQSFTIEQLTNYITGRSG